MGLFVFLFVFLVSVSFRFVVCFLVERNFKTMQKRTSFTGSGVSRMIPIAVMAAGVFNILFMDRLQCFHRPVEMCAVQQRRASRTGCQIIGNPPRVWGRFGVAVKHGAERPRTHRTMVLFAVVPVRAAESAV